MAMTSVLGQAEQDTWTHRMTDDPSAVWPLPKFHFEVSFDGVTMAFQEVTGLDTEAQTLEYRAGNNPVFSTIKMPGLTETSNITMRKGVAAKSSGLFDWFSDIKMNTIARKAMTISLLDDGGTVVMQWHVPNAFPVKIGGADLKTGGDEITVDTLVIAHEGFDVETG
ncbi:phage tail protein [uncultured Tateyamaria sp.]|uniref:phage tail protein n=1 Tax=Tateyamaria sp. 1078 TaxID=3417464 RepID=UPI0026059D44|nr:phage tail protein [uncultured Tateyamaria sp.]